VAAGYQPLDSDLTAIAALTTTAYGRALLSTTDAPTLRTAIGLGQTDAPTFLAQSLTGQSLTASEATNLLNLSATWNTIGSPSLIYGRVTNTNSSPTANLIDLGTFAGGSLFSVDKTGAATLAAVTSLGIVIANNNASAMRDGGVTIGNAGPLAWSTSATAGSSRGTFLYRDGADGILAQRNGTAKQVHRVYNTFLGTTANEWGGFDWLTTANTLRIGTEHGGTGTARPIDFVTGGVVRMSIGTGGVVNIAGNITGGGYFQAAAGSYLFWAGRSIMSSPADSVILLQNQALADFSRLQLGGTTSAFPALSRSGNGIAIVAADASQFTPLTSLYQRFGTGTPEGVVNAPAGAVYHRSDGGTGTSLYVKESLSGSTGWVAK